MSVSDFYTFESFSQKIHVKHNIKLPIKGIYCSLKRSFKNDKKRFFLKFE